jgi:hypothetical protein
VLTALGLDDVDEEEWVVEGLIVTSQQLPVAHVAGLRLPVLSLDELRTQLAMPG